MANGGKLYINGIDGVTGQYLVQPMEYGQVAAIVKGEPTDSPVLRFLQAVKRVFTRPHLGLPLNVEPADVTQAGWAIVFHTAEEQAVKDALAPLIEHRRQRIGDDSKVKVLDYNDGERRREWLGRHKVAAGTVEPTKVPYYVLLVGSPARIPFTFGHELDVEYAVGRLHFDTAAGYSDYVVSLIEYETSQTVPNGKEVVFFAPRHPFDQSTPLSADLLVNPLADGRPAQGTQPAQPAIAQQYGFRSRKLWGSDAKKAALAETLAPAAGTKPPAFLFTASHGMGWPRGHARQRTAQGALLCQDWPAFGNIGPHHYFAAEDLPAESRVQGLITFHFACFGAGTPSHDRYIHTPGQPPPQIADEPFIAPLPKALLAHAQGGALACIGHVERAWAYSITTEQAGPQLLPFQNAIGSILAGRPVGHAMKDFNERYAALSTSLANVLRELDFDPTAVSDAELATSWVERNDAEGYVVIGDPAVRLRVNDLPEG